MKPLKGKVLIVDDNKGVLTALRLLLRHEFEKVEALSSPKTLLSNLRQDPPDVILLDMNFTSGVNNGNEGLYWLKQIHDLDPTVSVVLITAYGDVELAVKGIKEGATDFVLKPWDNEKLVATIHSACQLRWSKQEVCQLKKREKNLKTALTPKRPLIIGNSPALKAVLNTIQKVAKTDANILITGENGTGKEIIANEIHRLSHRSEEVMITVDMGAVTETLFESELFGHKKGAFTDAREDRPGKFEVAHKGSLFLDEIGNLSHPLQSKLLSALQNRQITRVGSNKPIPVDIRLICATNKNLHEMVGQQEFREDLLYRINTIQVELPPLRERGEDVLLLAEFFIEKYTHKYNRSVTSLSAQAKEKLMRYGWPGNIREVQHTIEKAVILSEGTSLNPDDFMFRPNPHLLPENDPQTIEEMEHHMILQAIDKHQGNLTAVANQLGITRQTLYNKIKKFNIHKF